ncbi:hypothetical protein H5410_044213 [Solanum commersonii]|uniref:PGG domain-containing protein n=1 Tax=Solanum commersonii TaxID=4109 RepID=A0A9J5X6H4_SOLCO|nr:hypothetical protein H5410_044213 [Solanum commersonii]
MENNSSHDEYEDKEQFEFQEEIDIEEYVDQHYDLVFLINGQRVDYRSVREILYGAALKDNWKSAESILKEDPWLIHEDISHELGSILHIATQANSIRFLLELMKLIATMVFAVGFTVPGGNNSSNGTPVLLNSKGFMVFVISDAVALFSSIVSITMFLSILISRYGEDDFLVSLPAKLFFGLTALFLSIVSMLVAFAVTFFLVYSNHAIWEPKLIIVCAGIPVALFGCLQYKLWIDVARSTYRSKFLFRLDKHKVC